MVPPGRAPAHHWSSCSFPQRKDCVAASAELHQPHNWPLSSLCRAAPSTGTCPAHNAAPRHRATGLAEDRPGLDNGPMGGIKGRPGERPAIVCEAGGAQRRWRDRTEEPEAALWPPDWAPARIERRDNAPQPGLPAGFTLWPGKGQQQRRGKGQICLRGEGENRLQEGRAVYHGQVQKYFGKGGGQIMNCREFTSFWMGRRRDKGIACNPCFDHPHAIPPTGIVSSDCIQPRGTKKLPHWDSVTRVGKLVADLFLHPSVLTLNELWSFGQLMPEMVIGTFNDL